MLSACSLLPASALAADVWVDVAAGAGGDGTMGSPFSGLQAGIDAAQPGDVVRVRPGTYAAIQTRTNGTQQAWITIRSEERRQAIIESDGTALEFTHDFHRFEGLVFDATYGGGDGLEGGAANVEFIDVEVMHTTGDCIDLRDSSDVLIDGCEIHHCIAEFDPDNNADSHGVTGDSVIGLTIRDSEISMLTGDAVQLSPGRDPWDRLLVEDSVMWSGPLDEAVNGWQQGQPIGENAFDSKVGESLNGAGSRPTATFVNVVAYGWRGAISNQAAFNTKEEVDFVLDGATIYDSEIAGRLRGPASVRWQNVVIHDVDIAFRFEDELPEPEVYNTTFGTGIGTPMTDAGGEPNGPTFENLLFLADAVPELASGGASNLAVGDDVFEDVAAHDYRVLMGSAPMDAGVEVAVVDRDRLGVSRPFGHAYDVGAFEWTDMPPEGETTGGSTGGDSDPGTTGAGGDGSGEVDTGGDGTSPDTSGAGTSSPVGETDSGAAEGRESSGCGCSTSGGSPWLLLLLGLIARRRRDSA